MAVRTLRLVAVAVLIAMLAGCGEQSRGEPASGILGRVHLGPRCPVQTADHPCPDAPAAGVTVTVSAPGAGDLVARTHTTRSGTFRVAVAPGQYVVTADAGMSCVRQEVRVSPGRDTSVDLSCDTGIR